MRISVICVGKIKERSIADACSEYLKRLRNIDIIEVKDSSKAE
ncbi:MAG: 23S rRNA (pseudouridine(1915)-N(3))-methyltransferase RlmH, partial [Nanoarchaeota archaeon]|nr:23S rRNA (pseudouridine(1915)-N(3))-methyltransferase RlmH [Nanoarchaeota archaeon]